MTAHQTTAASLRRAVLALLVLLASCAQEPPSRVLEPVARLTDKVDPPRPGWMPAICAVDSEFRPSFGCMPARIARAAVEKGRQPDRILMVTKTPKSHRGNALLVVPTLRLNSNTSPIRFPPRVIPEAPETIALGFPFDPARLTKGSVGQFSLRPLPPRHRKVATKPIEIPEGAELRVGLALDAAARSLEIGATKFLIRAEWDDGRKDLLDELLPSEEAGEWHDRRIDLSDLAGKKVRFRFLNESPGVEGSPGAAAAFPIWGAPEILSARKREGRRNIVLISLDTVRADYMGGESRGFQLTPWFDQLTSEGTIFRQAVSTFSSTSASHMSLFTGTYPATHNVRHAVHHLPEDIPTLPQLLRRKGYTTGAVTENAMLLAGSGFSRGFDTYRENKESLKHTGSIDRTFGAGVSWLERHQNELFFLFLHTYEAHSPYAPKEEVLDALPEIDAEAEGLSVSDARWETTKRVYAAEVHYADLGLKGLFDELRRLDLLDDTLVVITSDHGEEFGEHGRLGHAKTIFDEVLRVPLLFWDPGTVPAGRAVDEVVSLVDVSPTILELAGIPAPPGIPGRSLVPALRGDPLNGTEVRFAEGLERNVRMVAARTPTHKWIWHDDGRPIDVYDLEADPGEQNPLDDDDLRAEGLALIEAYLTQDDDENRANATKAAGHLPGPEERVLDQTTRQKLEALGYVE